MCRTWGSNSGPLACQANSLPIELPRPVTDRWVGVSLRLNDGPVIKLFILVGWGRSFFICCWAHRGSTVGFLLLKCSSGVVRHPRDLQVSVATRCFCWVLIFVSSQYLSVIYLFPVMIHWWVRKSSRGPNNYVLSHDRSRGRGWVPVNPVKAPSILILTVPRRYICCGSLLLLVLAVRIYTLVHLLCEWHI